MVNEDELLLAAVSPELQDCAYCSNDCGGCEFPIAVAEPLELWRLTQGDWRQVVVEPPSAEQTAGPLGLFVLQGEVLVTSGGRVLRLDEVGGQWVEIDDGSAFAATVVAMGRGRLLGGRRVGEVAAWDGAWTILGSVQAEIATLFDDDAGVGAVIATAAGPQLVTSVNGVLTLETRAGDEGSFSPFPDVPAVRVVGSDVTLASGTQLWQRSPGGAWRLWADGPGLVRDAGGAGETFDRTLVPVRGLGFTARAGVSSFFGGARWAGAWRESFLGGIDDRTHAAFASDGASGRGYLFGGGTTAGDAFGSVPRLIPTSQLFEVVDSFGNLQLLSSTINPPPRSRAAMVLDPGTKRLVLFGGLAGDGTLLADTWTYDLATSQWTAIVVEDPEGDGDPSARFDAAFVVEGDGAIVLYGGHDPRRTLEAWRYHPTSWERLPDIDVDSLAAFQAGAHLPQGPGVIPPHRYSGFRSTRPHLAIRINPTGAGLTALAVPRKISLEGVVGGDGDDEDGARPGVRLSVVTSTGPIELGSSSASAAAPGRFDSERGAIVLSSDGLAHLDLTTVGDTNAGRGRLAVDSLAVRVRFEVLVE